MRPPRTDQRRRSEVMGLHTYVLINKIKEPRTRNGGGTVVLFSDEVQRYDEMEYE